MLKNAELSQNEEGLRQDLKLERDEVEELLEQVKVLQREVDTQQDKEKRLQRDLEATAGKLQEHDNLQNEIQHLNADLLEKNKV